MENDQKLQTNNGFDSEGNLFGEFKKPTYEEWKEAATALLKGKPFDKAMYTKTPEGITLQPIYMKDTLENLPHTNSLPGFAPYVRGTKATGNLVEPWLICQEVYASAPKEFNEIMKDVLYRGQTALNMALDMPTQLCMDPDDENAVNVGERGVSISTLEDLSVALNEIVLDVLPMHVNLGSNPVPMTGMLYAYMDKENKNISDLKGVWGYDPLGFLAKFGTLPVEIEKIYDLMAISLKWSIDNDTKLKTILVEGHPYHNGGADAIQEVSYAMATAVEYISAMMDRGFKIDQIANRVAFSFSLGSNFFMELSKIRAARVVWAKIIESFGGNSESQKIYIHGKTSSWTKTVYDPYVNMLRNASEAFSGAMGGIDSLEIIPFDEPIREADGFSRRISRNIQSILQDECHFTQPIDPAGGSWYIEYLTNEIAQKTWEWFQDIEKQGGMYTSIEKEEIQSAVELKYEEKFKNMAKRKHVWVGTNMYANMTEEKLDIRDRDFEKVKEERINDLNKFRSNIDSKKFEESLKNNIDKENVLEEVKKLVLNGASIGQIGKLDAFNSNSDIEVKSVKYQRGAERFENLRDKTNKMKENGKEIEVFSINIGPIPQHKPRADFSRGFFEVGGFKVIGNNGFKTNDEAILAACESKAQIGIICSTDAVYPEVVPEIARKIKEKKPEMILILAGRPPKELETLYREAGVEHFIYMGANCYELLSNLQREVKDNE